MKIFAFAFVLLAVVVCTVPRAEAFYGNCSIPQLYFFAAPYADMSTIEIVHALDAMKAEGVSVSLGVTSATQLLVVINATADHVLNVDFTPLDPSLSTIEVSITDTFGSGASSLPSGQSLALSLAAAGLVAGTASGKPGMGAVGAASLAALGLGLFGPLVSAASSSATMCPVSFVTVTVYIPGTVRNYTINSASQVCNVPYSLNATTDECTTCNSQFLVNYEGQEIPYPCVTGATECCPGEFCAPYTAEGFTLTHCCATTSQINSTTCCPIETPVYYGGGICIAVCYNTTTGAPIFCGVGDVCYENACVGAKREMMLGVDSPAEPNLAKVQTSLERQVYPTTTTVAKTYRDIRRWTAEQLAAALDEEQHSSE